MSDSHSTTTTTTTTTPPETLRDGGTGKPSRPTLAYAPKRRMPGARREKVLDTLKTLIWVIPLTILIWVYAEREQNVEFKSVTIPVRVQINNSGKVVTQRDAAITATVTGPHNNVQDFLKRIERTDQPVITHTIDPATPAGEIQIPVGVLNDDSGLLRNGITLSDISPKSLQATVDDIVTEALPVHPLTKVAGLEGEPRFTPDSLEVTAPRAFFEETRRLEKADKPYLTVDLSRFLQEFKDQPGAHDVPVTVMPGMFAGQHVRIQSKGNISAHFIVRANLATIDIKNVTVWPTAPGPWLKTHDAEIVGSQTFEDVVLEGPPDKINAVKEAIDQGQTDQLSAIVKVAGDTDSGDVVKAVTFLFPDGTHLAPGQRKFEATVRITPRTDH